MIFLFNIQNTHLFSNVNLRISCTIIG